MRKICLVFVFILGCMSLVHAQQPTASPAPSPAAKPAMSKAQSQKTIIATERKLWDAWKNKDMKPFRANLSADSLQVGDNGVGTKAEILKSMEGSDCEDFRFCTDSVVSN